jgi:hypothetical protein
MTGEPFTLRQNADLTPEVTAQTEFTSRERTTEYQVVGAEPIKRRHHAHQIRPTLVTVHSTDGEVDCVILAGVSVLKDGRDGQARCSDTYGVRAMGDLPGWCQLLVEHDREAHRGEDSRP